MHYVGGAISLYKNRRQPHHVRLAVAVFAQAVADARGNAGEQAQQDAVKWLTGDSVDFAFWARIAGYRPDWLARQFQRYYESGRNLEIVGRMVRRRTSA